MNGKPMTNGVPAAPLRKQRRKRGIVPKGGRAPLSPKEQKLHAQLRADGRLKSGRCGAFDYYVVNGKQRWRRHAVPKDPRTPAQQRSRARFAAASKAWSEDGPLTEAHRDEWNADAATRRSRPRLGSSGPLTGQQNFIGRNCTQKQRDSEMLWYPSQREQKHAKNKDLRPELTTQVSQFQPITRSAWGARRAYAVPVPSIRRVARGYARKSKARKLMSQVPRFQRLTRSTSDRHRTNTGLLPEQSQWEAGSARVVGKTRSPERLPTLGKTFRSGRSLEMRRGA
jgi:hypothetical protein